MPPHIGPAQSFIYVLGTTTVCYIIGRYIGDCTQNDNVAEYISESVGLWFGGDTAGEAWVTQSSINSTDDESTSHSVCVCGCECVCVWLYSSSGSISPMSYFDGCVAELN